MPYSRVSHSHVPWLVGVIGITFVTGLICRANTTLIYLGSALIDIALLIIVLTAGVSIVMGRIRLTRPRFDPAWEALKDALFGPHSTEPLLARDKSFLKSSLKVTFEDVGGVTLAKQLAKDILNFRREGKKFRDIGADYPVGVLLHGPSGCGKTHLVKALTHEIAYPVFYATGSEFTELDPGTAAARGRDLALTAAMNRPSIIFIDDVDGIGFTRGEVANPAPNISGFQALHDMFDVLQDFKGVVLFAATNRIDLIDPGLLQSGRFERVVKMDIPNEAERQEILEILCRNKKFADDLDLDAIARKTVAYTGAMLAQLINEAAILAAKRDLSEVSMAELDDAFDSMTVVRA